MITANIITLNEEGNIQACIESLSSVCDEIIVVDSGSTDRTVEIAESMGAKVIEQPYLGDGPQKNVALSHAKNLWILSIDADERLTPEMAESLKTQDLENTSYEAFSFRRRNMVGSRWIRHCGWYPDYCIRLFRKDKTRFSDSRQHSKVTTANVKAMDCDLIHYSYQNLGQLFAKPGRNFSSRAAKIMYQKGKRAYPWSPALHGLNAFVRKYVFQRGFLGGVDGMTVSLASAVNSYLKYAKLLEFQRDKAVLQAEDFDKVW